MPGPVTLITTVHDPEGRLLRGFEAGRDALASYAAVHVFATAPTDRRLVAALEETGAHVVGGPTGVAGLGQREVLAAAIGAGAGDVLLYDLDRWLHWNATYPDELRRLPDRISRELPGAWYVCLGRTERALATHPQTQVLPETATNRALSAVTGQCLDATAGAAWIRRSAAELILEGSSATSKATDLEWPALVHRAAPGQLGGLFIEGLEFETPDAYPEEIARAGSREAWIAATYDHPAVMRARLQLAADSIAALERVLKPE
jgi:hypothetical protein